MSCSRRYFRVCCCNRLTLKSQWIDTTDAYFSLVLPDQVRVKWVWKAGSAPHSHSVIRAEGGATAWSLTSYHSRTRLTENSHVGLPWWFIALPLHEAQVRSLAGEVLHATLFGKKKKKKGRTHTCSLHFVSEGMASLLSSAHWSEPVASPKCRGWDVQRSMWNVWRVMVSLFHLVLQHNAGLDASR